MRASHARRDAARAARRSQTSHESGRAEEEEVQAGRRRRRRGQRGGAPVRRVWSGADGVGVVGGDAGAGGAECAALLGVKSKSKVKNVFQSIK